MNSTPSDSHFVDGSIPGAEIVAYAMPCEFRNELSRR